MKRFLNISWIVLLITLSNKVNAQQDYLKSTGKYVILNTNFHLAHFTHTIFLSPDDLNDKNTLSDSLILTRDSLPNLMDTARIQSTLESQVQTAMEENGFVDRGVLSESFHPASLSYANNLDDQKLKSIKEKKALLENYKQKINLENNKVANQKKVFSNIDRMNSKSFLRRFFEPDLQKNWLKKFHPGVQYQVSGLNEVAINVGPLLFYEWSEHILIGATAQYEYIIDHEVSPYIFNYHRMPQTDIMLEFHEYKTFYLRLAYGIPLNENIENNMSQNIYPRVYRIGLGKTFILSKRFKGFALTQVNLFNKKNTTAHPSVWQGTMGFYLNSQ